MADSPQKPPLPSFRDDGVFPFYCTTHQPAMSGQIIVTR
jgi:plastocyanin